MGFLEERNLDDVPSITEYYTGKSIFITGGSGFMGKVLIEKLLYSCSELDKIYLLLRTKKGVKPKERLEELYSLQCFDRLRREKPTIFKEKVTVISGDVMDDGLGISEEDRKTLVDNVNIIFHVAASVRFDDPLKYAVKLNLKGTKKIVDFAKDMKHLSALIYVSTSYSNTNREIIEEIMYTPHADWRETLKVCEEIDEHTLCVLTPNWQNAVNERKNHVTKYYFPMFCSHLEKLRSLLSIFPMRHPLPLLLTHKYLGELPNTYTFTKQLAEHVVYEQKGQLPAVIIRPSIVISSVEDPFPGWIDNFNGPTGILVACGKGIMRTVYSDPDLVSDYIPVDVSIKSMISAAWIRGTKKLESTDDVEIYNCCSGSLNNMKMGEIVNTGKELAHELPLNNIMWNVGGTVTKSKTIHYIKVLLLHLLPALLVDAVLWVLGKKPMLIKLQRRIYIANLALQYYITKQWSFRNKNFILLRSSIKECDKRNFFYEIENIDARAYFKICLVGGRKYLLKEKDEDLPKARAHYKRIVILDKLVQCVFYGFLFWWIINLNYVQNLLTTTVREFVTI